jgi:SAM-dependent methyltransferase
MRADDATQKRVGGVRAGRVEGLAVSLAKALANDVVGPLVGSSCPACGHRTLLRRSGTFPPGLARAWQLSPTWETRFVERETRYCLRCKCNLRSRHYAKTLVAHFNAKLGTRATSLAELCAAREMSSLAVAEINGAGRLHPILSQLPGLIYSEYRSPDPTIRSEDLNALSYADDQFDLVLTSDTLEHIPDVERALREIYRVLKPGGTHIFTIPVVWDRSTLCRARLTDTGELVHVLPPSYHGEASAQSTDLLVFWEFGSDVQELVRASGCSLQVEKDPSNPALAVFVATKPAAQSR